MVAEARLRSGRSGVAAPGAAFRGNWRLRHVAERAENVGLPRNRRAGSVWAGSGRDSRDGAADTDLYFYSGAEPVEDRQETVEGEALQVGIADPREVRSGDAGTFVRGAYGQPLAVQDLDNLRRQQGLQLLGIRVLSP